MVKSTDADGAGGAGTPGDRGSSWEGGVCDPSVCRLDGPEGEGEDLRTSRDGGLSRSCKGLVVIEGRGDGGGGAGSGTHGCTPPS